VKSFSKAVLVKEFWGIPAKLHPSNPIKKPPHEEGALGFHQGLFSLSKAV
jgi:hypothetical protein